MSRSPADTKASFTRSTASASGSELSHCCRAGGRAQGAARRQVGERQPVERSVPIPCDRLASTGRTPPSSTPAPPAPPAAPSPLQKQPARTARRPPHLRRQRERRGRLELVVQHRLDELLARPLARVAHALKGADRVVRVHRALAWRVDAGAGRMEGRRQGRGRRGRKQGRRGGGEGRGRMSAAKRTARALPGPAAPDGWSKPRRPLHGPAPPEPPRPPPSPSSSRPAQMLNV